MRIGIVIGRIGGVDGVALETEKWIDVLGRMGHELHVISGEYDKQVLPVCRQAFFAQLSFFSPECQWEQNKAFFRPDPDGSELCRVLRLHARRVADALLRWIAANRLEALIVENASALPCHLSMGLGIQQAVSESGIYTLTHDHDFAWERPGRYDTPHSEVREMMESAFPLIAPNVRHAVINSAMQKVLAEKYGQAAVLVPNVMDFEAPFAVPDGYNSHLPADLGFAPGEIVLLQATRIVRRKGIEVAFDLLDKLRGDGRVKLLVTGSHRDDERGEYYGFLFDELRRLRLEDRVVFGDARIRTERKAGPGGERCYTLGDAYAAAAACTYFSSYEGFGNAFVEAVLARRPIFVNNYKPVYWPDIGSKGFRTVMLEDGRLTPEAVEEIRAVIGDRRLQQEIAEHNFELGRLHFSYDTLRRRLGELFERQSGAAGCRAMLARPEHVAPPVLTA